MSENECDEANKGRSCHQCERGVLFLRGWWCWWQGAFSHIKTRRCFRGCQLLQTRKSRAVSREAPREKLINCWVTAQYHLQYIATCESIHNQFIAKLSNLWPTMLQAHREIELQYIVRIAVISRYARTRKITRSLSLLRRRRWHALSILD